MDNTERFDRLDAYIAENRVLRSRWSDLDADGRERVCLLVALAPEVGARGDVDACPASLIPPWLAKITPAVDDCGTDEVWPAMVRRYSRVVRMGATTLDDAGWRRVLARFLLAVLAEAALHDPSESCQRVSALWARVLTGDEPSKQEWSSSARRAGRAASRAAWSAVSSAVWAADAASEASEAARAAAWAEAWAASEAAAAREAASEAAWEAAWAEAWAAAWDRMARALFDAIEAECAGATP